MKIILTSCVLLGLATAAWAEDCVSEKKRIQELIQQNAQVSVQNAQLQYNAAQAEKARLEEVEKNGKPAAESSTTAPAPAPAAAPAGQ